MKKIFIGCGILVALLLGALGYLTYKVYPLVKDSIGRFERFGIEIAALEESYPFDESNDDLDTERFASALDLRVDLKARFRAMDSEFDEYGEQLEQEDTGVLDMLDVLVGAMARFYPILDDVPRLLGEAQMGPAEYTYHCRVLWAALQQIGAGAGGVELEPLQAEFDRFRGAYGQIRKQNEEEWPPLNELIGDFDPTVIEKAKIIMATDTDRVLAGMVDAEFEAIYMKFKGFMQDAMPPQGAGTPPPVPAVPDGDADGPADAAVEDQ